MIWNLLLVLSRDVQVRLEAMGAFAAFFRSINKKAQKKFYPLIPEVLNILPPIKESQRSDQLEKALMALIDLAEVAPKMFQPLFNNLVKFSISVVQDKDLDDQARQNALELMATFADYQPNMCRKDPNYTTDMVTQCLSLMTDIGMDDDDAEEWNASEDVSMDSNNAKTLTYDIAARCRRKRSKSRCRRAVYGSNRQQARWVSSSTSYF
jgi:importin-5